MSRALAARIERLERRRANQAPVRQFGVFGGEALWRNEEHDGVVYCLPRFEPDEFATRCRAQQNRLFQELAEYAETLEIEGRFRNVADAGPLSVGKTADELPALPPGKKRRRFIEINGKEIDTFALRGIQ